MDEFNDGDIGLNLVCDASAVSTKATEKKKKNRYEKRRQKAVLAKQAKGTGQSAKEIVEKRKSGHSNSKKNEASEVIQEKTDQGTTATSLTKPMDPGAKETKASEKNEERDHRKKASNQSKEATNDMLQDDEERAKYMAQYHARPYEMDRRSNATFYIKPSHSSKHIFGEEEEEEQQRDEKRARNNTSDNATNEEKTESSEVAHQKTAFELMGLHPRLNSALTRMSLIRPTMIQRDAIPKLLSAEHYNVCIQSETGSGKTLAYLLPIVQSIVHSCENPENGTEDKNRTALGTQAIVVCPTRELATQTFLAATRLLQNSFPYIVPGCLSGGEKRKSEKAKLRRGVTILIATPGRLLDHLVKTECLAMSLKGKLTWLVLDEADRLLDMGLKNQIQEIVERLRVTDKRSVSSFTPRKLNSWRSVLVSATVTPAIQSLAETMLGGKDFVWSKPSLIKKSIDEHEEKEKKEPSVPSDKNASTEVEIDYSHAAPHQLSQLYMVVSSKLRLAALTAFLSARVKKGERLVVFMSTCDDVDFHYRLFSKMDSIFVTNNDEDDASGAGSGMFGGSCNVLRLHGNIPHAERQQILKQLTSSESKDKKSSSYVLFATDIAARGLNLPKVDWIVQYDPPCEITDYIHRAGRSARAGNSGHAILFLLPSEQQYVDVLKLRGLRDITAFSLSSTLQTAAKLCLAITTEGQARTGQQHKSRSGEAFAIGIQHRLEEFVLRDGSGAPETESSQMKKSKRTKESKDTLLHFARQAFNSYIRAYPTKEKAVRHIFCARALHLGHVARSFALREAPIAVSKATKKEGPSNNTSLARKRNNAHLAFENIIHKKKVFVAEYMEAAPSAIQVYAKKQTHNRMAMMDAARRTEREISEFA